MSDTSTTVPSPDSIEAQLADAAAAAQQQQTQLPPPLLGGVPETVDPATGQILTYAADPRNRGGLTALQIALSEGAAGVEGFAAPVPLVAARFREGDQFAIYSMTPAEVAALQDQLIRAGLLDPNTLPAGRRGFVGPADSDPTFEAYERLLGFANQAGYASETEALAALQQGQFGQGPGGFTAGARRGGGLPATISNPDDLRRVFRAAVIDTLGTGWSEDQIEALVRSYQGLERARITQAEQMAEQSALTGESPGVLEALPDPATFAIDQARSQDPTSAQSQDFLGAANQFFNLIGQWSPPAGELP